ncbi:MAG: SMI1/KNR4 family protein [Armatimonadetes bacterium]|nr:SMI1/KNR4 family protein [Anaerolineae bacterium]
MAQYDWHDLMTRYNQAILNSKYRQYLPPDVGARGWLGKASATEQQLKDLETRLQYPLPPSYRSFLAYSNGWEMTAPYLYRVWSAQDVAWFAVNNQGWIDAYTDQIAVGEETDFIAAVDIEQIEQLGMMTGVIPMLRTEHLKTALEVSEIGDAAIYLLNPLVINAEGEWEAWLFADWLPGARRYPSFWALMQAEYAGFVARQV